MSDGFALSPVWVAPVNEALAYRELTPSVLRAQTERLPITARTEAALERYFSGGVPEQGTLPAELINRMVF